MPLEVGAVLSDLADVVNLAVGAEVSRKSVAGLRKSVKGHRPDDDVRNFAWKVQESEESTRLVTKLSKSAGIEESDVLDFVDELCRVCWTVAGETVAGIEETALAAATEEVKQLKHTLNQCNLDTMKQMAAMRNGNHADNVLGDDEVTFHEPLKYLDPSIRELVLRVVGDKVRQLEMETAPPSLLKAITELSTLGPWRALPGGDMSGSELRQQLAEAEDAAQELQERADALEAELKGARPAVEEARAAAQAAERALGEVKEREAALLAQEAQLLRANEDLKRSHDAMGTECRRLEERAAGQQAEIAQLQEVSARHQVLHARAEEEVQRQHEEKGVLLKATEQLRGDVASLTGELAQSKGQLAQLKDEMQHAREIKERLEEAQAEMKAQRLEMQRAHDEVARRASTLEAQLKDVKLSYEKLEIEAKAMREEAAQRGNKKAAGTQTKLTGKSIDDQGEEVKRLRVMLVELQTKLGELVEKCSKGGVGDVAEIAESLGLGHLLGKPTVFQRLYEDAMDRVERLEKLRAKVNHERKRLGAPPEENEASILEMAEARPSPVRPARTHVAFEEPAPPAAQASGSASRLSYPAVATASTSMHRAPLASPSTFAALESIAGTRRDQDTGPRDAQTSTHRRVLIDDGSPRDGEAARPRRLSRAAESLPTLPPPTVGAFRAGTRSVMDLHLSGRPKRQSQSWWI